MIICLFLFLGLVFANLNVVNFLYLVADVELNLYLVESIIKDKIDYTEDLIRLKSSLVKFSDALLQPKVLRSFCGFAECKSLVFTKILNKFQIDTCNPFAERVHYDILDYSKIGLPKPVNGQYRINSDEMKALAVFTETTNEPIFIPEFDLTEYRGRYRQLIKASLMKFMVRRIESYAIDNKIQLPAHKIFLKMIDIYIKSGKPRSCD